MSWPKKNKASPPNANAPHQQHNEQSNPREALYRSILRSHCQSLIPAFQVEYNVDHKIYKNI
eukprot:scaffold1698_cov201-Alexandrium_tamarense.AAC.23